MKTESHYINVGTAKAPTVEIDTEADAVYVRFKRTKICRTLNRPARSMHIAIDLDAKDEVVGLEVIGAKEYSVTRVLHLAHVRAPQDLLNRVRYIPAALAHS